MNIKKKDRIQRKAIKSWIDNGKIGTLEIITGLGKTFCAFHALYTMPKDGKQHLFLAETTTREKTLEGEIKKYNEIFGVDIRKDYDLIFATYQSAYTWRQEEFGLVICDEIHDQLTPKYARFHRDNKYDALIGLSAMVSRNTPYLLDDGRVITKGMILDKICPVCFVYNSQDSKEDNTSRELDIHIIYGDLDDKNKVMESGSKKNRFYQTELKFYQYWSNKLDEVNYDLNIDYKKAETIRQLCFVRINKVLFNAKYKKEYALRLLDLLKTKTIIFSNSLDAVEEVTKNVISSRNSDEKNNYIINKFNKGSINEIGSFIKLQQGANLIGLDNVIIMSFFSKPHLFLQRLGRLRDNGEVGNVFILVTRNSREENWLEGLKTLYTDDDLIVHESINDFIKYIKTN